MTQVVLLVLLLAATTLSQGRVRLAVAGLALPALLVATSLALPIGVGEVVVATVFAVGTGVAWAGVIPAPASVQVITAVTSGVAMGVGLLSARFAAGVDPVVGAVVFALFVYGLEVAGSRSNPFGEWGSLAHSQTRQPWALAVARHGPHAVTLVLTLVSGSIGYGAATGSVGPFVLAAAVGAITALLTFARHRAVSSTSTADTVPVAGLIETSDDLFSTYVEAFVAGDLDPAVWSTFEGSSTASLRSLLDRTAAMVADGVEVVVWAEGAGLVTSDSYPDALRRARQTVRDAPCVLVASWMVLDRTDGLMSNFATVIDQNGDVVAAVGKQHPVPGPEAEGTRSVESDVAVVETSVGRLGVAICFDADHHDTWAALADLGVDIVAIPASDWPTIGAVHADMARLRSRSIRAALIRPARSGISTITDTHGQLVSSVDHRRRNEGDLKARLGKSA